jgi:nitrate reductase NapD
MNISGVLVHIRPEQLAAVKSRLSDLSGVEIHAATPDGRLVVTIENDTGSMIDTMSSLHDVEGVLSASLIYHHFDEEIEQ